MQTIMIDGSIYATQREMHLALKKMLSLPEYYGLNADALNDCLGEFPVPVSLWIASYGENEVASCIRLIAEVFADNGGTVKEL